MDYLRKNIFTKRFVLPPKDREGNGFDKDEIEKIALEKKKELFLRLNEIKILRKGRLRIKSNWIQRMVWEFEFQKELYFIRKWLNYWNEKTTRPNNKYSLIKPAWGDKKRRALEFPITDLYSGNLRQSGSRWIGTCPFHEEKTPSFFIFDSNNYHCFGCSAHGNSIDFLMSLKNLSFKEALEELAR